jgi:hypothetical protein
MFVYIVTAGEEERRCHERLVLRRVWLRLRVRLLLRPPLESAP